MTASSEAAQPSGARRTLPGKDAIAIESRTNNPYGNVIAVRDADRDKPVFKTLAAVYQSDEIRQFILDRFDGAILPVF